MLKKIVLKMVRSMGYKLTPITGAKPGFMLNVCGHKMHQDPDDPLINYQSLDGVGIDQFKTENLEVKYIVDEVKKGSTVIDIGANVGLMTLILAKTVGSEGKVYSFEPGPLCYSLLNANVLTNNYNNVQLEQKAVSSEDGVLTLHLFDAGSRNMISGSELDMTDFYEDAKEKIEMEAVSIDSYFDGSTERIDYIKLGAQGSEYKILLGMKKLLERNQNISLSVQYAPYLPTWKDLKPEKFLELVRSLGFEIYDLRKSLTEAVDDKYMIDKYGYMVLGQNTTLLLKKS